MKRLIALLLSIVVMAIGLASCQKSDSSASLEGTTWTATETTPDGSTDYYTLSFGKSTFTMQFTWLSERIWRPETDAYDDTYETDAYVGTYIYENPAIIMTIMIDGENTTINGVRDGDKLTLNAGYGSLIFTKK